MAKITSVMKESLFDIVGAVHGVKNDIGFCNTEPYVYGNILKHSKNIIDLIEVKDLVNFKNTLPNLPEYLENKEMIIHIFDNDTLEEIKEAIKKEEIELVSIVTHQQFKQIEYVLEE